MINHKVFIFLWNYLCKYVMHVYVVEIYLSNNRFCITIFKAKFLKRFVKNCTTQHSLTLTITFHLWQIIPISKCHFLSYIIDRTCCYKLCVYFLLYIIKSI